jgi:hypothetical protein
MARKKTQTVAKNKHPTVVEKEERQQKLLERLGFVQMMFDFYTAPVV